MNTLSFPEENPGSRRGFLEMQRKITACKPVSACISAFSAGKFPLEIEGPEGSFGALLLADLYRAAGGLFFAVVPRESDALDLALDLTAAEIPCMQFPWWGAAPYNELPPLSAVFGERARVLGDLVSGAAGVVIIPERAFLTPLPPPDYIKSLLVSLMPGGTINTTSLAETLVTYGYTRVPRVQVHGEFALRGEVLDILLGDDEAYGLLFYFDRIESIRRFDPITQSRVGGRDR
jgi:transcription-repair coupling factor (superfamily II helicase)